jgi:glycosyltransferase involved in cell wall biosynthesis
MTPIKVLHVFSGDLWAGAEVMIFTLLHTLRQYGDLRLVALALNEGELVERLRAVDIETHVISERAPFPVVVGRACHLARRIRADVIHSHRYKENLLAWMVAKVAGMPALISTLHGLPEATAGATSGSVRALGRGADVHLLRRGFDVTVAVSHEMKRVLIDRHGFPDTRVVVIHNGVQVPDGTVTTRRCADRETHVGTVARLVPVKALDLFIETAALVARETAGVRFSILGDGPLHEPLLALARARGIESRLRILPPVPDAAPYYRSLDLYVNTSSHEGLPLSVVEAMTHGTPVVAARVGGIPEIIDDGDHGFLVEGRNPADFARRILELSADPAGRLAMGERAVARARERFSAPMMAARYRALYQQHVPSAISQEGLTKCG